MAYFPEGTRFNVMKYWAQHEVTVDGFIILVYNCPFAARIKSMDCGVGSGGGSFAISVQIGHLGNTFAVGNMTLVPAPASTQNILSDGNANTVAPGDILQIQITATTGAPTGGIVNLNLDRIV